MVAILQHGEVMSQRNLAQALTGKIWRGKSPYDGVDELGTTAQNLDLQGWNSRHPFLNASIRELSPKIIVEIGVWKGSSVVFMAKLTKELAKDAAIIAVDTWRGSCEHWLREDWFKSLGVGQGQSPIYETFRRNIVGSSVDDRVIPLPLDSINAAELLKRHSIFPNLIHLDAGHDYRSVMSDLEIWWPLLMPGGRLIGDDYFTDGKTWAGVRDAVDEFLAKTEHLNFQFQSGKFMADKPAFDRLSAP